MRRRAAPGDVKPEPTVTKEQAQSMLQVDSKLVLIQAGNGKFIAHIEDVDKKNCFFRVYARIVEDSE